MITIQKEISHVRRKHCIVSECSFETYLVLVGFLREGSVTADLKELGLGNILCRSHELFLFLNLPVQNSGLGLQSGQRQSRRVKDE